MLRENLAELVRQQDATKAKLSNLLDMIEDGNQAVRDRAAQRQVEVAAMERAIKDAQQALAVQLSQPSNVDDVALIEQLSDDMNHADDDVRIYARGRVNLSLRRLLQRIKINPDDTFTVSGA